MTAGNLHTRRPTYKMTERVLSILGKHCSLEVFFFSFFFYLLWFLKGYVFSTGSKEDIAFSNGHIEDITFSTGPTTDIMFSTGPIEDITFSTGPTTDIMFSTGPIEDITFNWSHL